jgi:anti-anti-sigma factor
MSFHEDQFGRELIIARYLSRRLDDETTEAFESHYLGCEECFEELQAADLLARALRERKLDRRQLGDVMLLGFTHPAELVYGSRELAELSGFAAEPNDSKIVLDLSRVSRIDSRGLAELIRMHAHLARDAGALKVVNPSATVTKLLRMTRVDMVLDTYNDESAALRSFSTG